MTQLKPQNPPRKHHYIPEFYQKKWAADGKLVVFQKHYGRVRAQRKAPGATGYVKLLYAMQSLPPQKAQLIEEEYMRPVDNLAALARDALLARQHLKRQERGAWVQFIISLLLRTPEELELYNTTYSQQFERYKPELAARYLQRRSSEDPATYDEYLISIGSEGREKEMMYLFLTMMANEDVGKVINDMSWIALDVSKSPHKLMTSDRPIVMPYGLGRRDAYIAMPISPNTLFVAMRDERLLLGQMTQRGLGGVVTDINAAVVGQAYKFVYAVDESQARFVENRMAKLPRWSLIDKMIKKSERDEAAQAARSTGSFNIRS